MNFSDILQYGEKYSHMLVICDRCFNAANEYMNHDRIYLCLTCYQQLQNTFKKPQTKLSELVKSKNSKQTKPEKLKKLIPVKTSALCSDGSDFDDSTFMVSSITVVKPITRDFWKKTSVLCSDGSDFDDSTFMESNITQEPDIKPVDDNSKMKKKNTERQEKRERRRKRQERRLKKKQEKQES